MMKTLIFSLLLALMASAAHADSTFVPSQASEIETSVTNFNNNLSSADTDIQKALDTLDNISSAPASAKFITQQAESSLSAEFSLGSLTNGLLKHTVSGGVSTPATAVAGTDYYNPGGTDVALADGGTGASLSDPNADRLIFWDDSESSVGWLAPGNSIAITTTTMDTIQDIRTTATPQFARLGLGGAAHATIPLYITRTSAPGSDGDGALKTDYQRAIAAAEISFSGQRYFKNTGSTTPTTGHAGGGLDWAEDTAIGLHTLYGNEGKVTGRGGASGQIYSGSLGQGIYVGSSRNAASYVVGVTGDVRAYTDEAQTTPYTGAGLSVCFLAPSITGGTAGSKWSFLGNDVMQNNDDINMKKTSATGFVRAYATDGTKNASLSHDGSDTKFNSSSGGIHLVPASGSNVVLQNSGTLLIWATDNSGDIGSSGAFRPRTGYFGTSIVTPTTSTDTLSLTGTGTINGLDAIDSTTETTLRSKIPGYALQFGSAADNPADATTYFVGDTFSLTPGTGSGSRQIYIPRAGTIKTCYVKFINVGTGTTETSTISIRLNNTTDTTISSAVNNSSAVQALNNTSLSIAVVAGDYIEIKWVAPTWATNPTTVLVNGVLHVE